MDRTGPAAHTPKSNNATTIIRNIISFCSKKRKREEREREREQFPKKKGLGQFFSDGDDPKFSSTRSSIIITDLFLLSFFLKDQQWRKRERKRERERERERERKRERDGHLSPITCADLFMVPGT
ncbi:MAG: hypothetical protein Q8P67_16510 [archaeon]|nr:hypothetical protein [archaeon]